MGLNMSYAQGVQALKKNKRIKDLVREQKLLPDDKLDELLDPFNMTGPSEK